MSTREDRYSIAVVGMGNLLMADEGVGVHALRCLEGACDSEEVRWIDGGTDAWGAVMAARGCRHLVLVDAVQGGALPGTLYRLGLDELERAQGGLSLHEISLPQLVELETALGYSFESVVILGMEPAAIDFGIGLSDECSKALPALVQAVNEEIRKLSSRKQTQGARLC